MKKSTEILLLSSSIGLNCSALLITALVGKFGMAALATAFIGYSFLRIGYLTQGLDKTEEDNAVSFE